MGIRAVLKEGLAAVRKSARDAREGKVEPREDLLEELRVHQEELEAQNEELRRTHLELQEGLERFARLFQFAPVGYAQLTADGVVTDLNDTGETILRAPRTQIRARR